MKCYRKISQFELPLKQWQVKEQNVDVVLMKSQQLLMVLRIMIRLSVCFDTCHVHDAGYDIVNDFDGVLEEFDHIIGKDRISVIHINDSKNERGAMKDRHENIGFGHIGFDALSYIVHHPDFKEIPKILETPFVGADPKNKIAPYKFEIEMFKAKSFQPDKIELLKV